MRKAGLWALIIIVLFLALCGGLGFVLQIPFFLVVGWILYLLRVVPQVTLSPSGVVIGLLALLASTALCHTVVSWLWNHSHPTQPWRPRWTITCYFLVLLTFAAGICIVSITHQIYWIISSPKPFVDSDFHASDDAKASSIATVLQTMGSELPRYRDDHRGKFPTLRQLSDWSVMVGRTDSDGNVTPAGKLGPYIFGPLTIRSRDPAASSPRTPPVCRRAGSMMRQPALFGSSFLRRMPSGLPGICVRSTSW